MMSLRRSWSWRMIMTMSMKRTFYGRCGGRKYLYQQKQRYSMQRQQLQIQQLKVVKRQLDRSQLHCHRLYHLSTFFCNRSDTKKYIQDRNVDGDKALSPSPSSKSSTKMIRLSKRMSELDLCSRREADRLIADGLVRINCNVKVDGTNNGQNDTIREDDGKSGSGGGGGVRTAVIGEKVPSDITLDDIIIISSSGNNSNNDKSRDHDEDDEKPSFVSSSSSFSSVGIHSVVLNKPGGYVSGQAEHGHPPAIRLLTRENYFHDYDKRQQHRLLRNRRQNRERNIEIDKDDDDDDGDDIMEIHRHLRSIDFSWKGYAPAGRLDLDSTGLLVFTMNGVIAKKLLQDGSNIEKEYLVDVVPAAKPTKHELRLDPSFQLPRTTFDLSRLTKGGETLLEANNEIINTEKQLQSQATANGPKGRSIRQPSQTSSASRIVRRSKPLKPCHVEWIDGFDDDDDDDDDTDNKRRHWDKLLNHFPVERRRRKMKLRFILREGKKNQIKRMCRELIGWHVTHIHRVRIGPIMIMNDEKEKGYISKKKQPFLPVGCWRPLTQHEIGKILGSDSRVR